MSNSTDLDELVPWQKGPTERGGYSIIFSCLPAVITCTWTVLHLNLPGPVRTTRLNLGIWKPQVDSMTIRKIKWTLIMIIFPELVFAHAVLELRMALDDFVSILERRDAVHREGWHIWPGTWIFVLHDVLSGRWPALDVKTISSWPFLEIAARKISCDHERHDGESLPLGYRGTSTQDGSSILTAASNEAVHEEDGHVAIPATEAQGSDIISEDPIWADLRRIQNFSNQAGPITLPYQKERYTWTLRHVYFANMGGMRIGYYPVFAKHLYQSLSSSSEDIVFDHSPSPWSEEIVHPPIFDKGLMTVIRASEAEIKDKSKADTLLRVLWISQIIRLWLEVLVRAVVGLAVTQLEIITVSFSVLSCTIYMVHWKKPKDVCEPLEIHDKSILGRWSSREYVYSDIIRTLTTSFLSRYTLRSFQWEPRVPNDFWREEHESLFMTMLTVSTVMFGAIHCAAWDFTFPTTLERWLWRSCAVSGLALPLTITLFTLPLRRKIRSLDTQYFTIEDEYVKQPRFAAFMEHLAAEDPDAGRKGVWLRQKTESYPRVSFTTQSPTLS